MYIYITIRRSVNVEVILVHESNSKTHVVNMTDSTRHLTLRSYKNVVQKNVVYD